ncbi:universal stress protein [Rubrivirga sp. IMCC45206]|uniref:universal stress protein n=1 Tax=Rubrivirga sp. IMCC45206 TaxID=3391614 RepID=UPI00398F9A91
MTQRLLVVLDPDADTPVATDTAIAIARRYDAEVTGLALVDKDAIENESLGGGIGSMHFADKLRERLTDSAREQARTLIATFGARVGAAGVRHTHDRIGEDGLAQSLLDEMRTHDLLVAGRESHFYYNEPERRTHTLAKVLEHAAAATLIVGTEAPDVRRVAVAYDGSAPSARALQKFAHLAPFGKDVAVEIVHVRGTSSSDRLASDRLRADAATYLTAHGFESVTTRAIESSDPADRICELAQGEDADLIVSGAYAKSGFRKVLFGSSATKLLEQAKVPLFLYH